MPHMRRVELRRLRGKRVRLVRARPRERKEEGAEMKLCELKIKGEQDRRTLAAVLVENGYKVCKQVRKIGEGTRARSDAFLVIETVEDVK
jgi:hypothetical protein